MSCTPDGDEIADPTMIQVGDIRYLRRAGGLPPLRPVLGIAHAQDPAFGFQSEPSTGLRQDPDTGTVYWRRNGVDLYSMDDGGSGGDVAVTSITPVASDRLLGRDTAGSGACEELTVGGGLEFTGSGGIQRSALTGDVTASAGSGSLTIASDAVTYAKMQNVSATDRLLGRSTAGAGDVEEIPCTAAGRALLDDADAAAQRTTLGLAIGTDVQAYDAGLTSLAALPTVADRIAYSTAADTWAETTLTSFGRSLIDDVDAATGRNTLGASTGIWPLALGGTAADLSATGGTGQFLRQSSAGAAITVSAIGHADLGASGGTGTKYLRDDMTWQTVSAGVTDHGALTGLGDDDHTQYALLAGRTGGGGQTLIGGTASGDDLTLQSTSHVTKGNIFFGSGGTHTFDEVNGRWGFGVAAPARVLEVRSTSAQQRWSYDASKYVELTCGSSGDISLLGNLGARVIIGFGAAAAGTGFPIAIGSAPSAGGTSAIAIGRSAGAGNPGAIAIGASAAANNDYSVAIGQSTSAAGSESVAIGRSAATGTRGVAIGYLAVTTGYTYSVALGHGAAATANNQFVSGSDGFPISNVYFGDGVVSATPTAWTLNGSGGSGTNIAGGALQIAGGKGTGNAAGGSVKIQASTAGASGTTLQTLATVAEFGPATIGFYGVTPVARPTAYTQTYSTADRTLAAYTADDESAAYTGIDNAQVGTVYAQLTDLNALRTAYENLRAFVEDLAQHHNSVLDDLQAVGLLQ